MSIEDLAEIGTPPILEDFGVQIPSEAQWLLQGISAPKGMAELICHNDNYTSDDQEREERIAEIFRHHNIEVTFVD